MQTFEQPKLSEAAQRDLDEAHRLFCSGLENDPFDNQHTQEQARRSLIRHAGQQFKLEDEAEALISDGVPAPEAIRIMQERSGNLAPAVKAAGTPAPAAPPAAMTMTSYPWSAAELMMGRRYGSPIM